MSGDQRDTHPLAAHAGLLTSSGEHQHLGGSGRMKKQPQRHRDEQWGRATSAFLGLSTSGHKHSKPPWAKAGVGLGHL